LLTPNPDDCWETAQSTTLKALGKIVTLFENDDHFGTGSTPRYNRKVASLIRIVGGDSHTKRAFTKAKANRENRAVVEDFPFTEDCVFVKGYELDLSSFG